MPQTDHAASINAYLIGLDDGLRLASLVASAASELASDDKLTFPINYVQELQPVYEKITAEESISSESKVDFDAIWLAEWAPSPFPIRDPLVLAWSILVKYRTFDLGGPPGDPRIIFNRYPPRWRR
jgi:hypothetical protein